MTVGDRDRMDVGLFGAGKACFGGTVALHHLQDMYDLAHISGMLVTIGTASHAFRDFEEWHPDRGEMTLVIKIGDEFPATSPETVDVRIRTVFPPQVAVYGLVADADRGAPIDIAGGNQAIGDNAAPIDISSGDRMAQIADRVLAGNPSRAVSRPVVPEIGDDPMANVLALFGLTVGEFARLFRISERNAHRWRASGIPAGRRGEVDALQAIGMTVIGGFGPAGAKSWLSSGDPSGDQLVRQGRFAELAARAEAVKDSPFT